MDLRRLYLLAGILWALLLGPAIAIGVFAFLAGISWIYLFGDNLWPAAVNLFLPLAALISGLIAATLIVWAANAEGKRRAVSADQPAERRRARVWLLTPLAIAALIAATAWWQMRNYEAEIQASADREASFARFESETHDISGLTIATDATTLRASVSFNGERGGAYILTWRVVAPSLPAPLLADMRGLTLRNGMDQTELAISLDDLKQRYAAQLVQGRGAALVDEMFRLEVTLEPELTQAEQAILPPGEQRRIELGQSPLASYTDAYFPVRFTIP